MGSCEHAYAFTGVIKDLIAWTQTLMCNLIKCRLQDTMCPPTKLYTEPDLSA